MQTSTNRHSRSGRVSNRRQSFSNSASHRGKFSGSRTPRSGSRPSRGGRQSRGARKMPTFNPSQFINTNPVDVSEEVYKPKHTFETFGLDAKLVETLASLGLETPSPIQDQIIPEILAGRDVIGLAQTGTGKTAAFLLPVIHKTLKEDRRQTLILAPTRELAIQIEDELKKLTRNSRLFSTVCVGGTNIRPQIQSLRRKNHFIIGTPGRVLDLLKRKRFSPERITTVVLDEADRMIDMGFIHDIRAILSSTPKDRETLFFSATMSQNAEDLAHDFLRDPVKISVKKKDVTNSIEQNVVSYRSDKKFGTLLTLLSNPEFERVLIFGAMKHSVEKLSKQLSVNKIKAESIHGNKSHIQRQQALAKFKNGKARVLVATDVAARGIHVEDVTHVINYDLPNTFDDYVHRIGRTGRAAKRGKALSFVQA